MCHFTTATVFSYHVSHISCHAAVTPRTRRSDPDVSIFDDVKGRGAATPHTLIRNMTCSLQALATTPGPVPLAR